MPVRDRKRNIVSRLCECFGNYKQVVIVQLDNVSTNQIHKARNLLRLGEHKGEMIIGKNTLIKKALKFKTQEPVQGADDYEDHQQWTQDARLSVLDQYMVKNVGLIFSEEPYMDLREKVEAEKISQPARTGVIAPCDVVIPAGPTGIEVGKIDLFHKLNINCKTVKSAIEVVKEVKVITKGEPVTEGATQLCKLLNIIPFEYSLTFQQVYLDGVVLDQEIIEMPLENIVESFKTFSAYATAVSLGANIPNALSVPHFIANGFKSLLAIGSESGYKFKQLEEALTASANAGPAQAATTKVETKVEEKKVEVQVEEEEEEADMDLCDLFG